MDWWGPPHRLERFETDDELTFQTIKLRRKGEVAGAVIFGIAALVALTFSEFWLSIFCVFFAGIASFMWFSTTVRRLVVTVKELRGDSTIAAWSDVFEIRYEAGDGDGPSGLFARTGLMSSKCIFQDVSRSECQEIERSIYFKWPTIRMAPRPEGFWSEVKKSWRGRPSS
jgi:hypothetical protein